MADGGLKYIFEIDARTPGLDKLVASLDKSNTKLKEAHKNLKQGDDGFKGIGKSIDEVNHKLHDFGEALGVVLVFEGVEKLTEKFMELGKEIVETAGKTESLNFSLGVNFKGDAKGVTEWIDRIASKTPFTAAQLKGFANELGKAGVASKDLDKYIAAGLDVAAHSSDKMGSMMSALSVLQRAHGIGKIRGAQLLELGVPAENLKSLPGFEKLNKQQAIKKLGKSDINMEDLFRVISGGKQLGAVGIGMADLLDTKMKNVKTLPEQFMEKAATSPAMEPFKAKLDEMFNTLNPESVKGQQILKSFNDMLVTIVDGLKNFDFDAAARGIHAFIDALKELGPLIGYAGKTTGAFVKAVVPNKDESHLSRNLKLVGAVASPVGSWFDEHVKGAGEKLAGALGFAGGLPKSGVDIGKNLPKGIASGLEAAKPEAVGAVKDVATSTAQAGRDALGVQSPSKVFEEIGRQTGAGFALGMQGSGQGIRDAVEDAIYIPPPRPIGGAGGFGGGVNVMIGGITVHVAGHGDLNDLTADQLVAALKKKLEEELGGLRTEAAA